MVKDALSRLISRHQEKMLPTLLDGISDAQLAAQPIAGMNHPAWILGHLLAVEQKIAKEVLHRPINLTLDPSWMEIYAMGTLPKSDRTIYKDKGFYLAGLAETATAIANYINQTPEAEMDAPNPDPHLATVFPTIATLVAVVPVHRAYHSGQIATWRKAMGLPHAGM